MLIRLTKGNDKPDSLTCVRADGSVTRARLSQSVEHDLLHYAAETILDEHAAFLTLVARGWNLADFKGTGAGRAMGIPIQALQMEAVVGLLQLEIASGATYADFDRELRRVFARLDAPLPNAIGNERVEQIRIAFAHLKHEWDRLPEGETMELDFPEPHDSAHAA